MSNIHASGECVLSVPLELEVYKVWKETLSETVGDALASSIEKQVIQKLARSLQNIGSEKLKALR